MSGMDDRLQVVITMDGKPLELTTPVFWDWNDDDEDVISVRFYVKRPDGL